MKYAILLHTEAGDRHYLIGFTNDETPSDPKYTLFPLKELHSLWIKLEGDAIIYLS